MNVFKYIKTSIVFILLFIGVKMIASHYCEIPAVFSLSVILGMLLVGILASVYENMVDKRKGASA
jgi:tellurite resistance protein TerC